MVDAVEAPDISNVSVVSADVASSTSLVEQAAKGITAKQTLSDKRRRVECFIVPPYVRLFDQ